MSITTYYFLCKPWIIFLQNVYTNSLHIHIFNITHSIWTTSPRRKWSWTPYVYEKRVLFCMKFSMPISNVCRQRLKSRNRWIVCCRGSWKSIQHSTAVQCSFMWQLMGTFCPNRVIFPTFKGQSETISVKSSHSFKFSNKFECMCL